MRRQRSFCLLVVVVHLSVTVSTTSTLAAGLASSFSARTLDKISMYQGVQVSNLSIVYPILGLPARVQPGQRLTIRIVLHDRIEGNWKIGISRYGMERELTVEDAAWENDSWVLATAVPPDADQGLYDLDVAKGSVHDLERHAVSVGATDDSLTIVHTTDSHLGLDASETVVVDAMDFINLVHPDLVVFTGDFLSGGWNPNDMREFAELILSRLTSTVYLTPGNHEFDLDKICYYTYLNPYPDYAFDFGPVRFISLDQSECGIKAPEPMNLTQGQLDYLAYELSHTNKSLAVVLFHDPFAAFSMNLTQLQEYGLNLTLVLAGHHHASWTYDPTPDVKLVVTDRTVNQNRIIEFRNNRLVSWSYAPNGSAVPLQAVEIRTYQDREGTYQRLEIVSRLDLTLANASHTFDVPNMGEDWDVIAVGASIQERIDPGNRTMCVVRFDVPGGSTKSVECTSMVPVTEKAARALEAMISDANASLQPSRGRVPSGASQLFSLLSSCQDALGAASVALGAPNWTEASIQYSRARQTLEPITRLTSLLANATSTVEGWERSALDMSFLRSWLGTIIGLIQEGQCDKAVSQLESLLSLHQEELVLADEIATVNRTLATAASKGADTASAHTYLEYAIDYFSLGYWGMAKQNLETIRQQWPQFFQAGESVFRVVLVASILMILSTRAAALACRRQPINAGAG